MDILPLSPAQSTDASVVPEFNLPVADLNDPAWTINHVARCFHMSVGRAREYTSREDFPGARRLGVSRGRLLWPGEEVLGWFASPSGVKATERRYSQPTVAAPAADH